jgi:predicted nucleotidyltransferase
MKWNNIIQGNMREALESLQGVFEDLHIDFYVIGAVARDIWFAESGRPTRRTLDIDFAIYVGTREEYEAVKQYLKEKKGYQDSRENVFVLLTPSGLQVDILPFGGIELDGEVHLEGKGLTNIRVSGLQEVFEAGTETVAQTTGKEFRVASLAGIVLLKLVAYDDRPEKRFKDARDIANIIENYFDLQTDLIYEQHNDIFAVDDGALDQLVLEEIAAEVIGREIKEIAKDNLELLRRVQNILAGAVVENDKSSFIREMVAETGRPVNELLLWLKKMARGLQ